VIVFTVSSLTQLGNRHSISKGEFKESQVNKNYSPKFTTMKSTFIIAAALSSITYVLGTPITHSSVHSLRPGVHMTTSPPPSVARPSAFDTSSDFVCILADAAGDLAVGYGDSQDAALTDAKSDIPSCAQNSSDCNASLCTMNGCVAVTLTPNSYAFGSASSVGQNDPALAAQISLDTCQAHFTDCGTPSSYCTTDLS